jgi:C-terminal processing protease CtpA/Prc/tricorn protease-like protein
MKKLSALLFLLIVNSQIISQENLLLRHPAINSDGSVVAFSYQGDIWTAKVSDGSSVRLTVHEAYESFPRFSNDGKFIAFSGNRFGNNDVFVISSSGGSAKRITYHSAQDFVSSWTANGNILFSTNREFNQIERPLEVYEISSKGGTEKRVLNAVGFDPSVSPNGRFTAFVRGDINPLFRESYRGPSNREIWLYDSKTDQYSKIVGFETNDILPKWSGNNLLYFISSNSGRYNIYKIAIDDNGKAGTPEQITFEKENSIRHFDISTDGSTIVFEKDSNLYILKTGDKKVTKLNIKIDADQKLDEFEVKTFTNNASDYSVSPNGKLVSLIIRGELFVKEADKDKNRTTNLSNHSYRETDPVWLNDTTLIFTSDREDNNYELYLVKSADKKEPGLFKSLKHEIVRLTKTSEDESAPVISNNGKLIAYVRGTDVKEFIVADISAEGKLSNEKVLHKGWAVPSDVKWSPDDKWLAYSMSDLYFNEEVFIHAADGSKDPVNISMHPRNDSNPFWSPDGSKLGFISARNNRNNDVWFVWLKKEDWERTTQDWDEKEPVKETPADKKDDKDSKKSEPKIKPVQIDFDKIYERVVQVTNFAGDEANVIISKDGETFYYTASSSTAKGRDLYSIKWNGKELKELTKGGSNPGGLYIDKENKYLYYVKTGGSISRHDLKADKSESLPYSAKLKIDFADEREQMFEEAWRTIRDSFYDPQYHGNDWKKLRSKYKPLCMAASTNNDFRDMFNNMLGELNASHMGIMTQEREETQKINTGLLGAELVPSKEGMLIKKVIANSPADKSLNKLVTGETIISVNGNQIEEEANFYDLLNTRVDEKILLGVKDASGKEREVAIRPAANIRQLMYEEWVEQRRIMVEKYSNGKLGYIHIQGMNMPSFEVFERDLTAAGYGKDGLVIDVRYNGGGSTTDYLMTILNYKQHAYTIPRGASEDLEKDKLKFKEYYPLGERLVFSAWTKPSIALCNEGSYSNAEIFSHAYKTLGIGKLVGIPTNGSVISTGGKQLIDGSMVRTPFRAWFTKATDQNQELGPAVPDIILDNSIDWISKGVDEQLKKAVDELLKQVEKSK